MRIGIDARELCGQPTGVGRYLGGLLAAWAVDARATQHEFVLYAPEQPGRVPDTRRFFTRTVRGPASTWWEQVRLPAAAARDHLDVFFAPAYSAPLLHRIPTVLALHDLAFVAHPEWFAGREGVRRRWLARRSAARARAIVTISEFSKGEIMDRLHLTDDRVHVIPPGVTSPAVGPAPVNDGMARVLYVGSIFNRRHVPDLIRAFAPIARTRRDAALDIVGDNRTFPRQDLDAIIVQEALGARVRWRRYVTDTELALLYASSRAFAFLSEYEGLGFTPLEAIAAGVPPVLLDTAVARESCGDAAVYVPAEDIRATTAALEAALFDADRRATLRAAAPGVLARYSWPRAARETLAVIERSGREGPRVRS